MGPSDHLPVGAHFQLEGESYQTLPFVECPSNLDASVLREWIEILRSAQPNAARQARKQQRQLENVFLATLHEDERTQLRDWRASAAKAAEVICALTVDRVVVAMAKSEIHQHNGLRN